MPPEEHERRPLANLMRILEESLQVTRVLVADLERIEALLAPGRQPTRAVLRIIEGVGPMGDVSITVDTVNKKVALAFADDHSDPTGPPAGATILFSSGNPGAATLAPDPADASGLTQDITPVAEGSTSLGVAINGADGAPLPKTNPDGTPELGADGVTPVVWSVDPVTLNVGPGLPETAALTVS